MNNWHGVDSIFLLVKKQTLSSGMGEHESQTVLLNSCTYGTGELYPAFLTVEDAVNFLKKHKDIKDNHTIIELPVVEAGKYDTHKQE